VDNKPKVVPTLDDGWKEPRVKPKRCPACQRPNKPEATKCSVCGYDLAAMPPAGQTKIGAPAPVRGKIMLVLSLALLVGAGGAVYYFGLDDLLSRAESLYKPEADPTPAAGAGVQAPARTRSTRKPSAGEVKKKTLESVKDQEGACFNVFNDMMDKSKRGPVDPNALHLAYLTEQRQLNNLASVSANCGGDTNAMDTQKAALCDSAARLKTCLGEVMAMQIERIESAGYRIVGDALERIKP